jgi:hypothetical protein
MTPVEEQPFRARVPADVERPDRILGRLTARQVALLAVVAVVLWVGYLATERLVPPLVYLGAAAVIGAGAFGIVIGRRDGLGLDAWLAAALRHHRRPRRLVPADGPIASPPAWIATAGPTQPPPAPLRLPARGVDSAGLVDLGSEGTAALVRATTINFALRTPGEQTGLLAGFARWLNSLDTPTQILVRAHRVDLEVLADRILERAPGLSHPALEQAAREHAAFLDQLADDHELLHRQILIAVRDPRSPTHAARAAVEAVAALGGCQVTAEALDGASASTALAGCLDPGNAGPGRNGGDPR